MSQVTPRIQWSDTHRVALEPEALYLVETSPGVWELDDAGAAEGVIVETDPGVYELDDDPTVAPDLRHRLVGPVAYLID